MVFGQNQNILLPVKNDSIEKGTSRGAERRTFQLRSTFQQGVIRVERNVIETVDYSLWFLAKI